MNQFFKKLIKKSFATIGLEINRKLVIEPWYDDKQFDDIMKEIGAHTCVDRERCYVLYQLARHVLTLSGDVAEVGVYKGGTAKLLSNAFSTTDKIVHLFDTFSGLPQTDPKKDIFEEGLYGDTSLEAVQTYLGNSDNVKFYRGVFPSTTKPVESSVFCLIHVDVD